MPHWHQAGSPAITQADPAEAEAEAEAAGTAAPGEAAGTAAPGEAAGTLADPAAPADAADSPVAAGQVAGTGAPGRLLALLVLGALTVILGGFGIWATVHANSLRAQSAQQNTALVDPAATSAVLDQVDSAVQTIFSYNYANTNATRQAAQKLLTGQAIQQYDSLFALVQKEAPAEKLVVKTTVTNSGVELLSGGQARVLIFVDQQDTRAGSSQTSYGGAMLAVTAISQAGQWKIESMDTFTGS